jgi:diguanylate cyclase (GGDEF)-like protein
MTQTLAQTQKAKILVIDDERFNLNTLHALLREDYQIMVAPGGEQGLKAALTGRPDLILLDINMPDISGFEICRKLKAQEETQGIPVIFITAMNDATDETRGLELGAVDYITKPFNLSVVKARVRTHLRLKQQNDLLESFAFKDGLTGLSNRRAFNDKLENEWKRCGRVGATLSVLMMDVDHFKMYNDHYGHGAGDECLVAVAKTLGAVVQRAGDMVARYGGEEFVVVLPDTGQQQAMSVAAALCGAVAGMKRPHATSKVSDVVTISVGVGTLVPDPSGHQSQLLSLADSMLYQAKAGGRNTFRGQIHG